MTYAQWLAAHMQKWGSLPSPGEAWEFAERQALERAAEICDENIDPAEAAYEIRALIEGASSDKEWICVADRLPTWTDGRASKTKVYVLARTVGGVEKECGFYLAGPDGAWDDYDYSPLHRVTHWKPIASSKEEPTS